MTSPILWIFPESTYSNLPPPIKHKILTIISMPVHTSIHFEYSFQEEDIPLDEWLSQNLIHHEAVKEKAKQREVGTWIEIRLFISSTFIDTHSERDILVIDLFFHEGTWFWHEISFRKVLFRKVLISTQILAASFLPCFLVFALDLLKTKSLKAKVNLIMRS